MPDPFPDEVALEDWEEARRRADAMREHLRRQPNRSTIDEILELATTMLGIPPEPAVLSLLQHN